MKGGQRAFNWSMFDYFVFILCRGNEREERERTSREVNVCVFTHLNERLLKSEKG